MELAELLKQNEKEILRQLIELSRNPTEARALIDQLEQTRTAMGTVPLETNRYSGHKRPIDAVKALLNEAKQPLSMEEIKDTIVNKGGFRRGDPPSIQFARMVLQRALKAHLPGADGHKNFPLKVIAGKYGKAEWPDAMFRRD